MSPGTLESRPYRVLISVAFGDDAALSAEYRRRTVGHLGEAIGRGYGSMWDIEIVESDWLFPASRSGLERVTPVLLAPHVDSARFDKAFLVTVATSGARYDLCAREWDAATRTLGPPVSAATLDRNDVAGVAAGLVRSVFQPVLAVERVEGNSIVLRVRAGRLSPRDPSAAQVRPGDLILPCFRYLDEELTVRRIQFLPWTYLIADSVDGGRVKCSLASGLRSPLGGSRRRSVDVVALRVRPHFAATRLKLVPRDNPSKPLVGYTVTAISKRQANDEAQGEPLNLVTDRQGFVEIPSAGEGPLVWLYVRSGESLLSRVPFAPGIAKQETIELPDDSLRLAVEGATDLLVNRLVDTVARRAVLMARARISAREGDWKSVDEQLARLDELPRIEKYKDELTLIRVPALEAARAAEDGTAAANVNRISSRVSELIDRYLAEEPVRTLKSDLRELRKLDAEDKRLLEAGDAR